MKKILLLLALMIFPSNVWAQASFSIKDGGGSLQTVKSNDCSSTICPISVPVDTTGTAFSSANPFSIKGTGTAGTANAGVLTVQGIASMTPILVNPGTASNWGVGTSTQNSSTVANGHLVLGQFNTSPTTITSGNMSPLQVDNAGNLLVNIKTGASSGAVAQGSTTSGQTGLLIQGAVTTSSPSYTTAQTSPLSLDTSGNLRVNVVAGGAGGGAVTVADGADVTQGAKADSAAGTGTVTVVSILKQLHLDVTGAIPAGTAIIGKVGIDQTSDGTTNAVHLVAGTAIAGKVGIDQTTPGTTNAIRTTAGATGGGTLSSAIAPATPAGVNLKASAGTVFRVFATTIQATPVYIKFYNSASAPICGSGTPVARFMVPSASTAANGAGTNIDIGDIGAAFGTGIGYCVTGALADADTTAITTDNTLVNIVWN